MLHSAVAHSTFAALTQTNVGGVRSADMVA
jgi:hypothetical protein